MKLYRKCGTFMLAVALVATMLAPFAVAYDTADFSDVAATHWAYANIMEMADAGIIKGVGEGRYAPADSLTVGSFLALIGRSMYPAECVETSTWWEVYYLKAVEKGLVDISEILGVPSQMERGITRNEMARIMVRVDELVIGNSAVKADTSKITDYASIPAAFQSFAAQAYTKGLLTGDENGNFNGSKTLRRDEAATVIKRLLAAESNRQEQIDDAEPFTIDYDTVILSNDQQTRYLNPKGFFESVTWTSSAPAIVEVSEGGTVYAVGSGSAVVTGTDKAGRTVTCAVTSRYVKPETDVVLSGNMVTVTIRGLVSCWDYSSSEDGVKTLPTGVNMTWMTEEGTVLGSGVTGEVRYDEKGEPFNFTISATFDKIFFDDWPDRTYSMKCTYIDEHGNRFSNISSYSGRVGSFQLSGNLRVSTYDFTGGNIYLSVGNNPELSQSLDF